jgi:FF domain
MTANASRDDIPGAEPWVQVTTKWRRTFYHNPQTGESFWNVPEAIRPIVEQVQLQAARANALPSESEEEDESEEEYDSDDLPDEPEEEQEKALEMTEEDMYYQLAQMQEEFGDDGMEEDEEELDPATKRAAFISLLEEKDVNPFNTWETEMPKIVHDPRYQILKNTKARTDVFEEWTRARIAAIKEEKSHQKKEDVSPPLPV